MITYVTSHVKKKCMLGFWFSFDLVSCLVNSVKKHFVIFSGGTRLLIPLEHPLLQSTLHTQQLTTRSSLPLRGAKSRPLSFTLQWATGNMNLATRRTSNQAINTFVFGRILHITGFTTWVWALECCLYVSTGAEACLEFDPMKVRKSKIANGHQMNEAANVSRFLTKDSHNYKSAYTILNI